MKKNLLLAGILACNIAIGVLAYIVAIKVGDKSPESFIVKKPNAWNGNSPVSYDTVIVAKGRVKEIRTQ